MQSVIIGRNQAGQRLDKFLRKYLPGAGTSFIYKMLRKKNITLNGKKAEGKEILEVGDEVQSFFSDETFAKFSGGSPFVDQQSQHGAGEENSGTDNFHNAEVNSQSNEYLNAFLKLKGIDILYEDKDILAVNKPAGILTQKAENTDLSLNEWLVGYLLDNGSISEAELRTFHPSVCNRLDRNTSGIVLCGKSLPGSQFLSKIIKDRNVHKFYRTICVGKITDDILLEGCLKKDSESNKVKITQPKAGSASNCRDSYIKTAFHPLKVFKNYTYLEVELFTGKTHQIRAHLSSIGHPVIGDCKYGNAKINKLLRADFGLEFQLLHAYRVEFPTEIPKGMQVDMQIDVPQKYSDIFSHLSGMEIVAPIPGQFKNILDGGLD